ncbi:Fe(3+)-hydroxamate ABC transporter permease FhuB [Psychrobacter sp. I-STPA10]|uniref:Fe(3+)-hydroxamate ABC transporter permease FhuB n=1 Tax=Psychrobacter sp. I-STPA10 TaxID=2585769 RepID=UPI001E4E6594|nr:Fe(3+)-hydroxamate ABC transporter permease FhuB [Psychrobacter sp. I-STPA10]
MSNQISSKLTTNLILPKYILLVGLFIIATICSSIYLIQIKWQWSLSDLLSNPSQLSPQAMIAQLILLAESGMAFFCGGLLAVVSILLQQVVRNNLASDSTLAVGSGALLTMVIAMLFFPSLAIYGSFWVAFVGAMLSLGLVLLIALPSKLDPLVLILAGFVVSILANAVINVLMLFDTEYYSRLTLWSSGLLYQIRWQPLQHLTIASIITLPILMLLHKPLMLMSLDDEQATRLGLPVQWLRFGVFILCAVLTALVVSNVGLIGFVGLGAATMVNAMQVRHIRQRILLGFLLGGLLLWLTNNLINILTHYVELPFPLPAGTLTGVLGAPLIIWLILKQRKQPTSDDAYNIELKRQDIDWWLYIVPLVFLFGYFLVFVQTAQGWQFSFNLDYIMQFRLGRSLGAAATGVILAIAGVILQQMTRNPMASPDVLGISSAASITMVMAFMFIPNLPIIGVLGFGVLGSLITLLIILWLSSKVHSSYLLLIGIAVGALTSSSDVIIGFSQDPRLQAILNWLSGTTYYILPQIAYILLALAIVSYLVSLITIKPIKLLSLTEPVARELGLPIKSAQAGLLIFVAILSTITTVTVGPLSFIGLMTPQLARSFGAVQIEKQLPLAALLGAMIMLTADWIGRYAIFPYEIPAGILASVLGGAYFLVMMRKFR